MRHERKDQKKRGGQGFRKLAEEYLLEMESHCLEVVLIPSKVHDCAMRGGMIRAVQSQNADWYRKFCAEHESDRKDRLRWSKFKTKIKRAGTRRALRELIAGKCETYYAKDLKEFIQRYEADQRQRRAA